MTPIPLSLFFYSTRHYLTHPWLFFKELWIGAKNAYHRARYGWCWVDLWNMDTYLDALIPNMLDELANRSCGWPSSPEWPRFEDWTAELHTLATLWRLCGQVTDIFVQEKEEFDKGFAAYRAGVPLQPIQHLPFYNEYVLSEDEVAAIDNCTTSWERMNTQAQILRAKLFQRFSRIYPTLWD